MPYVIFLKASVKLESCRDLSLLYCFANTTYYVVIVVESSQIVFVVNERAYEQKNKRNRKNQIEFVHTRAQKVESLLVHGRYFCGNLLVRFVLLQDVRQVMVVHKIKVKLVYERIDEIVDARRPKLARLKFENRVNLHRGKAKHGEKAFHHEAHRLKDVKLQAID